MARSKKKAGWIAGGTVIAIAVIGMSFLNLGANVVYFYTPAEAVAKCAELSDKTIRVGGMVLPGSVQWQAEALSLDFTLSDLKETEIAVHHKGTPPDLFKEGQGVVVEGRMSEECSKFIATTLMVKHSEEYQKPDDHGSMEKALLEKSLFKNEKP